MGCMRFACWINKATNTPSEYIIIIVFPLRQWTHERALMLRYTYIASLVFPSFSITSVLIPVYTLAPNSHLCKSSICPILLH
jgi:hypothetical protein